MNFIQAIISVIGKYAIFSGRASRSEFWYWKLFYYVVLVFPFALLSIVSPFFLLLGLVIVSICWVPNWSVTARRLHDFDRSGWWQLSYLIPYFIIGLLAGYMGVMWELDYDYYPGLPEIWLLAATIGMGLLFSTVVLLMLFQDSIPEPNKYGDIPEHKRDQIRPEMEPTVRDTGDSMEATPRCVQCNNQVDYGQNFCHLCGSKQPRLCKVCGTATPETAFYCGNCGERINNS